MLIWRACVPISWTCKKQTAKAEVISLNTGRGVEGLLALKWLDTVVDVLEPLVSRARGPRSCQLVQTTLHRTRAQAHFSQRAFYT